MLTTSTAVGQVAALLVAGCGCACDIRTRRIPNALTFGAAAAAVVAGWAIDGFSGVVAALSGWIAGAAMLLVPFALGGMGAGDVKLLGAIGAWLGPSAALWAGVYTTLAGGAMALVVALASGYLREAWRNVTLMLMSWRVTGLRPIPELTLATGKGPRLAYAAPILAGTVVAIWLR